MNHDLVIDLLENKLLEVCNNTDRHISAITSRDYNACDSLPPMQTELASQLRSAIEMIKNEKWKDAESLRNDPNSESSSTRILVFSPLYEINNQMRHRIINTQFIGHCSDITHYKNLTDPTEY